MTMTDVRKEGAGTKVHLAKAREWLSDTGLFTPGEVAGFTAGRVMTAMDKLYTGGWAAFVQDAITVEAASEWELSW